jgi:hypothetical protein
MSGPSSDPSSIPVTDGVVVNTSLAIDKAVLRNLNFDGRGTGFNAIRFLPAPP